MRLLPSGTAFAANVTLSPGPHMFKFLVDGAWTLHPSVSGAADFAYASPRHFLPRFLILLPLPSLQVSTMKSAIGTYNNVMDIPELEAAGDDSVGDLQ